MITFKKALFKSMGLLFLIFIICALFFKTSYAQLQLDYPFKAISDDNGNIYITGEIYNASNGTMDIFVQIFPSGGTPEPPEIYTSAAGDDKGYSLAIDDNDKIAITGYVYNNSTNSNDIAILRYDPETNIWDLNEFIESPGDDRGLDITIVNGYNIAVCGYQTSASTEKDMYVRYLDLLTSNSWEHVENFSGPKVDDIATSILADGTYLYTAGYGIQADGFNDLIFVDFAIAGLGYIDEVNIIYTTDIDEVLTSCIITDISKSPVLKSKRAATAEVDYINVNPGNKDYLTLRLDNSQNPIVRWSNPWPEGTNESKDIPTAITSDLYYVYVTGYTVDLSTSDYNFGTLKYQKDDAPDPPGGTLLKHEPYGSELSDDRPSSIRLTIDGFLCVTGYSTEETNDYVIVTYDPSEWSRDNIKRDTAKSSIRWKNFYRPELPGINLSNLTKYTYCSADSNGNVTMMVFGYNDSIAFYSGQTYDREGKPKTTIRPQISTKKNNKTNNGEENKIVSNNYPNPFNPVTNIKFHIPNPGFVEMYVYDITGKKVELLLKQNLNAGAHNIQWNASKYPSGVYFYTIKMQHQIVTKKIVLVK